MQLEHLPEYRSGTAAAEVVDFYSQAVKAFPKMQQQAAATILAAAPTRRFSARPARRRAWRPRGHHHRAGGRIGDDTNRHLADPCGRAAADSAPHRGAAAPLRRPQRPGAVEQMLTDLKPPALRKPEPVEQVLGITVEGLSRIIVAMRDVVDQLESELAIAFDQPQLAPILRSVPGLGPVLAARLLAETGDDLIRFAAAARLRAFAGTAPVTLASGRSHYVKARKIRNKRLGDACHWWGLRPADDLSALREACALTEPAITVDSASRSDVPGDAMAS